MPLFRSVQLAVHCTLMQGKVLESPSSGKQVKSGCGFRDSGVI